MSSATFNDIVAFIPRVYHPKKESITRESELEVDLGITGDDADEFIVKFGEKFNVDIENFNPNEYFLSEGEDHFQTIKSWLFGSKVKKNGRKRITVGDLEKAIKSKKLV
jgi:acyl carrier protein